MGESFTAGEFAPHGGRTFTARLKTGARLFRWLAERWARRVPPPLRFGAALILVSSGLENRAATSCPP
jgi:hypothetical protein